VELLPRLYPPRRRLPVVRAQSRRNFGRPRATIERSFGADDRSAGKGFH
jgi:hypothetical protein